MSSRRPPENSFTSREEVSGGDRIQTLVREGALIGLAALCLFLCITLITYDQGDPGWSRTGVNSVVANAAGPTGAWLSDVFFYLFGVLAYFFPLLIGYKVYRLFRDQRRQETTEPVHFWILGLGFALLMLAGTALMYLGGDAQSQLPQGAGGLLGETLGQAALTAFGQIGAELILVALFLYGLTLFTGLSWLALFDRVGHWALGSGERLQALTRRKMEQRREQQQVNEISLKREEAVAVEKKRVALRTPPAIETPPPAPRPSDRVIRETQGELFTEPLDKETRLPAINLLDAMEEAERTGYSAESLEAMSRLLELKLKDFSVIAEVVAVQPGPVVTRFEIQPAPGVKASKITNLARDLARSLAVISVRVVEVIAGKSVMGIEIPNEKREMVRLRQVLSSHLYDSSKSSLTIALGHDISGQPVIADLARMPHLLVAGTTGSGKSVAVNVMLLSLLYKATPADVRLLLVDPKMLELAVYEGIPHLLAPVITDMKDAANGLRWCVGEMERRYKLMSKMGVRNLAGFNRKVKDAIDAGEPISDPLWTPDPMDQILFEEQGGEGVPPPPDLQPLPAIVVVIDEFADMMMIVGKKVEQLIARIAQKARAAGIHLILATQRPSVDVITGLIKANIPTRMAFQVSSRIDSRTILDQGGAEQLLGHGDMLFLPSGTSVPIRVHGAFVDDHEVHRVVEDWTSRGVEPDFIDAITDDAANSSISVPGFSSEADSDSAEASDALYDQAVAIVTESRKASISSVQRKLRIGYNRAARLIEAMEEAGVVTEMQSNGNREVLAPPPPRH